MTKKSFYISVSIITIFTFAYIPNALGKSFGGKITNNKSLQIQTLENSGYKCTVTGKTITARTQNGIMKEFYISPGVRNVPGYGTIANQQILGLFSTVKTPITCILEGEPPVTTIVNLDTIRYYGTSLR